MTSKRWGAAVALLITSSLSVAVPYAPSAEARPQPKNTFGAQCWLQSQSGLFRAWWDESGERALAGADQIASASDGNCSTVPDSVTLVLNELDATLAQLRKAGLPMPKTDRGVQRLTRGCQVTRPCSPVSDDGSPAYDVLLDGRESGHLGAVNCYAISGPRASSYRTLVKMDLTSVPAAALNPDQLHSLRVTVAHELVHFGQCAVKDSRRGRNGTDIDGEWAEAIPNAIAFTTVGGAVWDLEACRGPETEAWRHTRLLSTSQYFDDPQHNTSTFSRDLGYQQWDFWNHLLGQRPLPAYLDLLTEVSRSRTGPPGRRLETAVRKRYSDAQLRDAILAWMSDYYFGGSMTSSTGLPLDWELGYLAHNQDGVDKYVDIDLQPQPGSTVSGSVTLPPLSCTKALASWPVGSGNLSVSVSGGPAVGLVAGADVAPGRPPTAPCGVARYATSATPRVVFPVSDNRVSASRPCGVSDNAQFEQPIAMWLLLANGSSKSVTVEVTATAS